MRHRNRGSGPIRQQLGITLRAVTHAISTGRQTIGRLGCGREVRIRPRGLPLECRLAAGWTRDSARSAVDLPVDVHRMSWFQRGTTGLLVEDCALTVALIESAERWTREFITQQRVRGQQRTSAGSLNTYVGNRPAVWDAHCSALQMISPRSGAGVLPIFCLN